MALVPRFFAGVRLAVELVPRSAIATALLLALTYIPLRFPDQLFQKNSPITLVTARYILRLLLGVGLVRTTNRILNVLAQNHWRVPGHPPAAWDFYNELAVVTGGSSGIGAAISEKLAAHGTRVAILDIQPPLSKSLASNSLIVHIPCDVSSYDEVYKAAKAIHKDPRLGADGKRHVSILINNAGITTTHARSVLELQEPDLRKLLGVNLMSLYHTTRCFLPAMLDANKGHIVTMSSLASYLGLSGPAANYSASKAASMAFHESLTCEIRRTHCRPGVLTSVVHPSFIVTPMTEKWVPAIERAVGKMLYASDVARPVVEAVIGVRGKQIIIPESMGFLGGLRGWPCWLQEGVRDVLATRMAEASKMFE